MFWLTNGSVLDQLQQLQPVFCVVLGSWVLTAFTVVFAVRSIASDPS